MSFHSFPPSLIHNRPMSNPTMTRFSKLIGPNISDNTINVMTNNRNAQQPISFTNSLQYLLKYLHCLECSSLVIAK